jgi:signal recognition particle subunit SRP54
MMQGGGPGGGGMPDMGSIMKMAQQMQGGAGGGMPGGGGMPDMGSIMKMAQQMMGGGGGGGMPGGGDMGAMMQ